MPNFPLHLVTELRVDGEWVDISADVRVEPSVSITRGRQDESERVSPTTLSMRVNNRAGRYSPRNPNSPYYGHLGRNTPIRFGVQRSGEVAWRFTGEASEWPARWDVSDTDVWVGLEAAGIMRRLTQGQPPLRSLLRRMLGAAGHLAYWPLEDGADSTQAAAATPGTRPARARQVDWAGGEDLPGSDPVIRVSQDTRLRATVPSATSDDWRVWVYVYPAEDPEGLSQILNIWCSGHTRLVSVQTTESGLRVIGTSDTGEEPIAGTFTSSGIAPSDFYGHWGALGVDFRQDGSDLHVWVIWYPDTLGSQQSWSLGSFSTSIGRVEAVTIGPLAAIDFPDAPEPPQVPDGWSYGHLGVGADFSPPVLTSTSYRFGLRGEPAVARMQRLCEQEGIDLEVHGDAHDTHPVGAQGQGTLLELLRECAEVDGGTLGEARDGLGLLYRTGRSRYNQEGSA